MFERLLKEPLLHFLVMGLVLFAAFRFVSNEEQSDALNRIVVDRDRLLTFMQNRARIFGAERFEEILDNLPEDELQALIDDYVREEALYREAKALNLDKNDYTSRQRLIRQLEYINQGFISSTIALSESEVQDFLSTHQERYYVLPKVTFTHVFFNADSRGEDESQALALAKLDELNESQVPFHKALSHGDRYLYHRNYVNKEADEIASHFGSAMQRQLFVEEASDKIWRGPFRSPYGFHLVMMTKRTAGYAPPLEEVRQWVEQDAIQARLKMELDRINQFIVEAYEVEIIDVLKGDSASTEGPS